MKNETPNSLDFSILNDEDVFCLIAGTHIFLFKGSNPFDNPIKGLCYSPYYYRINTRICSKESVTYISKASDIQKHLFFKHYPEERPNLVSN